MAVAPPPPGSGAPTTTTPTSAPAPSSPRDAANPPPDAAKAPPADADARRVASTRNNDDPGPDTPSPRPPPAGPPDAAQQAPGWWDHDDALKSLVADGAADALGMVWIKNHKYPWWPARRVPEHFHHRVHPGARRPKSGPSDAYQYFGTHEYQWVAPDNPKLPIATFSRGFTDGHAAVTTKGRSGPIARAVAEACAFAKRSRDEDASRSPPPGMFDYVPPPPTPEPTPEPTPSPAKKKPKTKPRVKAEKKEKKPKAEKKPKKPTKAELRAAAKAAKAAELAAAEAAKAAELAAAEAARRRGWPELTALTSYPRTTAFLGPDARSTFALPHAIRKEGRPPPFKLLQRSQWTPPLTAPRPFPRAEVEACLCEPAPEVRVAMHQAHSAAKELAAKKREAAKAQAPEGGEGTPSEGGAATEGGPGEAAGSSSPSLAAAAASAAALRDAAAAAERAFARVACGPECFNRSCHTTCDPRVCPCGPSCGNRPFHLLPSPKTRVALTETRGWGLFAEERVSAGSFVVEYVGEIIDDRMTEQRLWEDKRRGEDNFYLMEVSNQQIIDARHKGGVARFINSSCHPNCETQKWQDASTGETRVGIFAIRDVERGEELSYDYNFAHFGGEGTTSFTCMCGHPMCRGTLDANPERTRNYGRRVAIQRGGDGGEYRDAQVLSYHNKTEKYLVVYDRGEQEHVKLEGAGAPRIKWLTPPTTKPFKPAEKRKDKDAADPAKAKAEEKKKAARRKRSASSAAKKRKRNDGGGDGGAENEAPKGAIVGERGFPKRDEKSATPETKEGPEATRAANEEVPEAPKDDAPALTAVALVG